MRRGTLNFWVDLVSGLVLLGLTLTGLVMRYVLPPGSGQWRSVWGLTRHEWGDVHFWLAVAGVVLLGTHVALHWSWVCSSASRIFLRRTPSAPWANHLAGVTLLLLLVGLCGGFLLLTQSSVQQPATRPSGLSGHVPQREFFRATEELGHQPDTFVRGAMTLREAAAVYGVEPQELVRALGLAEDLDPDERLGRLARRYGFSIQDVRQAGAELSGLAVGIDASSTPLSEDKPQQTKPSTP